MGLRRSSVQRNPIKSLFYESNYQLKDPKTIPQECVMNYSVKLQNMEK